MGFCHHIAGVECDNCRGTAINKTVGPILPTPPILREIVKCPPVGWPAAGRDELRLAVLDLLIAIGDDLSPDERRLVSRVKEALLRST